MIIRYILWVDIFEYAAWLFTNIQSIYQFYDLQHSRCCRHVKRLSNRRTVKEREGKFIAFTHKSALSRSLNHRFFESGPKLVRDYFEWFCLASHEIGYRNSWHALNQSKGCARKKNYFAHAGFCAPYILVRVSF